MPGRHPTEHRRRARRDLLGYVGGVAALLVAAIWWTALPQAVVWHVRWRGAELTLPVDGPQLVLRPGEAVDVELAVHGGGTLESRASATSPWRFSWRAEAGRLATDGHVGRARWVLPALAGPAGASLEVAYSAVGGTRLGWRLTHRVRPRGTLRLTCPVAERRAPGCYVAKLPPDSGEAYLSPSVRVRDWVRVEPGRPTDCSYRADLLAKVEAVLGSLPPGAVQLVRPATPALTPRAPMVARAEHRHKDGVAADLWVGDLTGDRETDLLNGRHLAVKIEQLEESGRVVPGGCGLYQNRQGRVCIHLDVSGESDRWGAAVEPGGASWPVRWSAGEQDAATRCARLSLSPGEGSLRLVVRKRRSLLCYDADAARFVESPSLTVWVEGTPVRSYPIALGSDPVGDKHRYGDGCTPEGEFYVCRKNPQSRYFRALQISYPNEGDAERGLRSGLITAAQRDRIVAALARREIPPQNTSLGRDLYIHGGGIGSNWTQGCVALTNEDMAELYEFVPLQADVEIRK
ncbi:MAG: hypothetical protein COZ06_22765 [Armatimonadetes bacterium CG_4_10_14_3_um_filter_66_18]|nr:L,D-transpeptidase family protein [Armatimonadota bacterium]OIO97312.1 MAG: hypothetical protein AUJ96_23305 [Armatimonadetes bacterium CG2_30_66_41]PIU88209.1 MAG: hypothetical protein COS65_31195 [Armatimonadetes bacterium CG06_land_8_20_14_3_00_66_21]PIX37605.1 MAG: hypothetical protein COZ57_33415 [Armatimonadetes bacterium CG_4_8_14_3_um_filter_66_20]PIY43510.1 MAG: hypothetical protein COZ06_22765 [Armatimonadetes bacterium CG_4_10_14_3_um_filter_66_18]PIZ47845.1 MAG: hypothetical pro